MKKISIIIGLVATLFVSVSWSRETRTAALDSTTTQGVTVVSTVPGDISMLVNHQKLVSHCWKSVGRVNIKFHATSGAQGYDQEAQFEYLAGVKTLGGIMDLVRDYVWRVPVVSTNTDISIDVKFMVTNGLSGKPQDLLFEGVGGGKPVLNGKQWVLPTDAEEVSMLLPANVYIPFSNILSARVILGNDSIGYESMELETYYWQGFFFRSGLTGQGILVLDYYEYDPINGWFTYKEKAVSLKDGVTEVPITPVLVQVMIRDSEDFNSSINQTDLTTYAYSTSGGYGKVPLLTPTYNGKDVNWVYLQTYTTLWDDQGKAGLVYASSYEVENLATGHVDTNNVSAGANGVWVKLPEGSYHISSLGLNLKSWDQMNMNGSVSDGFGKGAVPVLVTAIGK